MQEFAFALRLAKPGLTEHEMMTMYRKALSRDDAVSPEAFSEMLARYSIDVSLFSWPVKQSDQTLWAKVQRMLCCVFAVWEHAELRDILVSKDESRQFENHLEALNKYASASEMDEFPIAWMHSQLLAAHVLYCFPEAADRCSEECLEAFASEFGTLI
jgi:hypothetical protein